MPPWLRLAWKEFWLPFHYRKSGCPGGRDFVWLTTFMALMLTLILLLLASREGMLNRFVDVLLGNVPGYGVPVSVTNNMLSKGGINAIDSTVLEKVKALKNEVSGLQVFPHRRLEAELHPLIRLPEQTIWENRQNGSKFGPDFDGWAVQLDDPLWSAGKKDALPLEITISRSLFKQFFNYGSYRNFLRDRLPEPLFQELPVVFRISKEGISHMRRKQAPAELLQALQVLEDKNYASEEKFLEALTLAAGQEPIEQYKLLILQYSTFPSENGKEPDALQQLWLEVKIGFSRELFPFKITWVERFPVIDKISYVFPLSTYHALKAAHDFTELRYFPEGQGAGGKRFKQIMLEMPAELSEEEFRHRAKVLQEKLGGELIDYRGDLLLSFEYALRRDWLDAYTGQYGLPYDSMETISGDTIGFQHGKLALPCGRMPSDYLREYKATSCADDRQVPLHLDITGRGNGFRYALIYVPDRRFLSMAVSRLKEVADNALTINSAYQDALNRFGFLSEMLAAMERPYSWFLAVFLLAFLGVQIGTLIGHHRHRYGVFLAKGVEWWQIYAMLWLQIALAMGLGMLVAFGAMSGARFYLQQVLAPVAESYAATLSVADLNLLPLSGSAFLMASIMVLALAWGLATLLLYFMPLRQRTHPAMLL